MVSYGYIITKEGKTMAQRSIEQITKEIEQILALNDAGNTMGEIAENLHLSQEYIYHVLISRQSYSEDAKAIAHMILLDEA